MSGELQTIPARHGVATFVPRGRTIKIINTYGKQVVSTWAFGLHAPPEEGDDNDGEEVEEVEGKAEELKEELEKEEKEEKQVEKAEAASGKDESEKTESKKDKRINDENEDGSKEANEPNVEDEKSKGADDPPEQAPDTPPDDAKSSDKSNDKKPEKRTWSSYLPSIPYRSRNQGQNSENKGKPDAKTEKAQNEAVSKKWSSYLPTGKGFSSYVPNVQMPDTQGVVSAFKASHNWDPNKSYAEQLYDFSKTPVGAGTLAAATGSGTASSLYAAYNAYTKLNPSKNDLPPMEYLSLPHTRASTNRLVPEVSDTLLTNLRNPIMTLVEDTSTGAHDTLTAACDANLYATLGIDKPEEHGSCAENLVLALKELNEKAGLKGTKAIGADITVNIAPTPLHLFMNAPLELDSNAQSDGAGAKGATLKVEEPKSKKRSYVRFRAERDIVVVLSACPMEIGPQNGGRCMAANFMVENAEEDMSASSSSLKGKSQAPKKHSESPMRSEEKYEEKQQATMPKPRGGPQKAVAVQESAGRRDSGTDNPSESAISEEEFKNDEDTKKNDGDSRQEATPKQTDTGKSDSAPKQEAAKKESSPPPDAPKPKRKPKKLERRGGTSTPSTNETS